MTPELLPSVLRTALRGTALAVAAHTVVNARLLR
ncbi:MAG: hypothetical protein QOJ32_2770, partial [Frankiaceae bacterium]|nr:hypothetical protein [Frankiaceae bacterium]